MKKLIILLSFILVASIAMATNVIKTGVIKTGTTALSRDFTFTAADTLDANDTITIMITNNQRYLQHVTFTTALVQVTVTPSVVITAYGRVTETSAWVAIGSAITWTSTSNNGSITSVTPANYNDYKIEFVASSASQKSKITVFEAKTANCYDIPANSGTLTVSRADAGTVTIQTADDNDNAAAVYRAGGTGALTLGAATGTTAITSSDWAISATGIQTGMGAATFDGVITATGGIALTTQPSCYWAASGQPVAVATGTDVACANGARFWVSINIPYNSTITGLSYLVGSVGGTDSVVIQLCNSAGAQVATTRAVGGAAALVGTAAQMQSVALTTPYAAVAGRYYAVVQFNGTTAKFRAALIPGSKFVANTAAGTWGTKADITPGTTFVADKAPFICTY
jgi:hypothetical protein